MKYFKFKTKLKIISFDQIKYYKFSNKYLNIINVELKESSNKFKKRIYINNYIKISYM